MVSVILISNDKITTCVFHLDFSGSIADINQSFTPKVFNFDNPERIRVIKIKHLRHFF